MPDLVRKMRKPSKDTINWIVFVISGVALVFTIIGVSVGTIPSFLGVLDNITIGSMILAILSPIVIILLQGVIPIMMVIRRKEQSKQIVSINANKTSDLEKKMRKPSKDTINWIILVISGISLVFTIIGVSVGFIPSILAVLFFNFSIESMILAILTPILIILLQGVIPILMVMAIRKKEQSKHFFNINDNIIILSLANFFLIWFSGVLAFARQLIPITGLLLLLAPLITLIASTFFKDYKFPRKFRNEIIFDVLDTIFIVFVGIPSLLDFFFIDITSYLAILSPIVIILLQGLIPIMMFMLIKKKKQSKHFVNMNFTSFILSTVNFLFILFSGILAFARQLIPIAGLLLFLAPLITFIASNFFKDYKFPRKFKTDILFNVLDAIFIVFVVIPLFLNFLFIDITGYLAIMVVILTFLGFELLLFAPSFLVAFFVINLDDRSQLLKRKYWLYLIAAIVGTIIADLIPVEVTIAPLTKEITINVVPNIVIAALITLISSFVLKFIYYKRIPYGEIRELTQLEQGKVLLQINNLKVYYPLMGGVLKRQIGAVKAVDGVNLNIKTGETVGLVGESGCGKTTLAKAILGLVDIEEGEILFNDIAIDESYSNYLRQKIQIVFQDPDASLNPRMKVVDIISEPLKNILGITKKTELRKHVLKLLEEVSMKREHLDRYPHEFSGGQKQRIVIARALACNPELIILDEPTSALDVSVQAQILNLLKNLQQHYHYGFLFITHNLGVVNHIANQIAVMYLGRIVELGTKNQIFSRPTHPYTQALLKSRIKIDPDSQDIKYVIDGEVPSPINPPQGCHFNPRCVSDARTKECEFESPHKMEIEENHYIWCVNPPKEHS